MLSESKFDLIDVARYALGYFIRCSRIVNGTEVKGDRDALVELAEQYNRRLDLDRMNETNGLFSGHRGLRMALAVEERFLDTNSPNYKPSVGEPADFEVTSLAGLMEVLGRAKDASFFDKYVLPLRKLFNEWHDLARESTALLPYEPPPTKWMRELMIKDLQRQQGIRV